MRTPRNPLAAQALTNGRPAIYVFLMVATLMMALALPLSSFAQTFPNSTIYVNNQGTPNNISAYTVDGTSGALTELPGSPATTGSNGADGTPCRGLTRMVQSGGFVFVSNASDQSITSFTVQPGGSLQSFPPPLPGPPPVPQPPTLFPSGLTLDSCQGISLAASPNGSYLFASGNGTINTFAISPANGTLSIPVAPAISSIANCCSPSAGMRAFSNAGVDYLALSNLNSVSVFIINADGSLTAVAGSPFPKTGTGAITGLQASCGGNMLFGSEASTISLSTDAWSVAGGVLTPIPGSPFNFNGAGSSSIVLTPDNEAIFESGITSPVINSASVSATGTLSNNVRTSVSSFISAPEGMDIDSTGQFLFTADDAFGIAVQRILGGGALANIANTPINRPGQIQEVIANPPRGCAVANLVLTATPAPASVEVGAPIAYTVSLTNSGPGASSVVVSNSLPASLSVGGNVGIIPAPAGAVRSGGVVTVTTALPHAIVAGEPVTVSLLTPASPFSGTFTVTAVPTPTSFQYAQALPDATEGGGTASTPSCWFPGATTGFCSGGTGTPVTANFPSLAAAATETFILNVTSDPSLAPGAIISNTIAVANKSAVNPVPANDSATATVTVIPVSTTTIATTLTVSPVTAGYGAPTSLSAHLTRTSPATSLAGQTVSFTIDGTAFGSATTSSLGVAVLNVNLGTLAVGPHAIGATFATSGSFTGSTATPGVLTITTAVLTVVPTPTSNVYGSAIPITLGFAYSGFMNGDTSAVVTGTPTCSLPATVTVTSPVSSPSNIYTITCVITGLSAANYTFATIPGTFTITPAPLNITADNQTRAFGAADPVFTGTITGILNGDAITATYTSNDTASSPAGTYPIVPTAVGLPAVLSNYSITLVNGTLTVTPVVVAGAPLTVTMNNVSRPYGSANPAFTATITGALNGDTFTVTATTTATAASPAGAYPITIVSVTGANIANYVVTQVPGTLTVSPAPVTVVANPATGVYGSAPAGLTTSFIGLKNGDVLTATLTTTATATSPVIPVLPATSYPITVGAVTGLAAPNYTITRIAGTYTITPFPLTVTAPTFTRVYGAANPAIVLGGPTVADGITAFVAAPGVTSPVGTYTSMAALTDPLNRLVNNYTVSLLNGIATVTRAPLTITPASQSMNLGAPAPSLTAGAIYAGLVGADTPASLTGTLKCTASSSNGGLHLITCSGQSSNNYTITFATGILTVNYVAGCTAGPGLVILPPLVPAGSPAFVKATTTSIPISFRACDVNGKSVSSPVIAPTLTPPGIGSATITAPGGAITTLSFTVNNGLWTSTFTTAGKALGTYTGTITLNDGTVIPFSFSLT